MENWSEVTQFRDGDSLNAKVLNLPIWQLGDRTDYLYRRLKSLISGGTLSAVVLTDVELSTSTGEEPYVGNVVYMSQHDDRKVFAKARAAMSLYDDFTAANSAFSVGILRRKEGSRGDVVVYGSMELEIDGNPMQSSVMLESGEEYRAGRYYLSANEAGKLTANPNGPLIYVCSIGGGVSENGAFESGASAVVGPQFLDIGTSHVHRTAVLTARPAGTLSPAGYLPTSYGDDPSKSLAIKFGGEWRATSEVTYKFWFSGTSATWAAGVMLYWKEWHADEGAAFERHVSIPAPDVEVEISNGLTARISFPDSDNTYAYNGLAEDRRTWENLTFPESGKGWTFHDPHAVAMRSGDMSEDGPVPMVAVRGGLDASPTTVNIAFPAYTQVLTAGSVSDGMSLSYRGTAYVFSKNSDESEAPENSVFVDIGPTLADTMINLAAELEKSGVGKFAVLDSDDGTSAKMVAMDADDIAASSGSAFVDKSTHSISNGYNVLAAENITMVVFDGEHRILGDSAVVENVKSYTWKDLYSQAEGRRVMQVMVFQDKPGSSALISAGDSMHCIMEDDDPDAVYDYAMGFEPAVANYWPPVPVKSAALVVNGVEMDNKALVPDNPTVSFGRRTIHWFANAEGRLPWPEDFTSRGVRIDPAKDKTEVMHWVRGFQGATGPVTSLQAREGSPFKIVGYGTDEVANTGDLEIVGDFDFKMVDGGAPGYIVPKRARNGKLVCGSVVERIVGGAGIAVISHAGSPDGQGTVVIAMDNGAYHSQFSDLALENAEQAKIGMFPYIRLKGYATSITSPSAFTAMMRVPTNLPNGRYALKMQASVFGENGFDAGASQRVACVKMSYNILPDYRVGEGMEYRNLKTSLLKPNGDRTVYIPFGHEGSSGFEYNGFDPIVIKTRDELDEDKKDIVVNALGGSLPTASDFIGQEGVKPELRPGNLVGIRLSRAVTPADYEAYTGPIGFINLSWSLVSLDGAGIAGSSIDTDAIEESIRNLQEEMRGKVSKDALSGVEVATNTAAGIREAVKALSGVVGADVVK